MGVATLAGLPLLAPPAARRRLLTVSAGVVLLFAVATLSRNGLFFLPSAAVLCWAVTRHRNEHLQ